MRCKACNKNLSDREANRKFTNFHQIQNPEDRYINLCDWDLRESGLEFIENPLLNDDNYEEELLVPVEPEDE